MKEEAAPFRKIAESLVASVQAEILVTGIGRQNAEQSVRGFLATHSPDRVLTCGFAGGLNPDLKRGEVVFETLDEKLRAKLLGVEAKPAKFFCAGRIATSVAEKKRLRDETGADAVEMES